MNTELDYLLKLRLVVARHGEMDAAGWWNTKGMLGRQGSIVLRRGFPQTYRFAQARATFAVARNRCATVFSAPGSVTLWALPGELEDRFASEWQRWLDERELWVHFQDQLENAAPGDLLTTLQAFGLIDETHIQATGALKLSVHGSTVPLQTVNQITDETLAMLAAGFSLGERGKPIIPYTYLGSE